MGKVTLHVDDEVLRRAHRMAESMGESVDQLVQEFLEGLSEPRSRDDLRQEFIRLSQKSKGDSKGWKFNRDELHER